MRNHVTFAVPGSLDIPTGGYLYDKFMVDGLRKLGWSVNVLDVGTGFPRPGQHERQRALEVLKADESRAPIVVDGLALGTLPEAARQLAACRPLIGLVHHPLFLETGHSSDVRQELFESEKAALSHCCRVITTSRETQIRVAREFDYCADRISTIEPGIIRPEKIACYRDAAHVDILSVGTLVPRKGHDQLINSLASLRNYSWKLRIVGSMDLDPGYTQKLRELISTLHLQERVVLYGNISDAELSELFQTSDLFALASEYEGYGIAYAEAILHGLPVVGTTGGAIKDTVPPGTGILVAPGDQDGLRTALKELISNPERRRALAECARRSGSHFQTWETAASRFASVFEDV